MRTLRIIGALGITTALLLSSTVAFAEGRATNISSENGGDGGSHAVASSTIARIEAEHQKVEQRLLDIRDKVKQQMAQQLANQFDNLNKTWTDHFTSLLDQYTAILQKIQDRANVAASAGKDVSSTTVAIQAAQTAIANARAAVAAQAAKTYALSSSIIPATATSTSSGQLKIMQALRKSFHTLNTTLFKDLFALRDGPMKDVRRAVQNALATLEKVPGVGENNANPAKQPQPN